MKTENLVESVPLHTDDRGTIRVGGTRVTLETVLADFDKGSSAEEIVHHFDVLRLDDVYAVIAYYLRHREEVDAYRQRQSERGEALRKEIETNRDQAAFRQRLLARLEERRIA